MNGGFLDIDKFVSNYDEREQNRQIESRRQKRAGKPSIRARRPKKSAMTGIRLDSAGKWDHWVVCSFKNEEMRFRVWPSGTEEEIQRRKPVGGEWTEWENV